MSVTFKDGDIVRFTKAFKYGSDKRSVCPAGLTATIVPSNSSIRTGDNRAEAVERHDNGQIVRSIPIAYIEHA